MKWDSVSQSVTLLILALLLLGTSVGISVLFRRNHQRIHNITLHVIQLAAMIGLVVIVRQFVLMARQDYGLDGVSLRSINLFFGLLIIFLMLQQLFLLINRLVNSQIRKGSDPTSSKIISRIMKVVIAATFLLLFGEHFGIGVSGLLAFGGIGGIAIGLAGQNILSNFFSGIMLYFDRPFNIGDWIRSPDRNIEGTVVEIGWRITKIITFDNRPLYVPNSLFTSISVENPGRMTNRRINAVVGLRYEDVGKLAAVVDEIRTMLQQHPEIDQRQDLLVYFNEFAGSSVNIMVYCFCKTTHWAKWLEAQQDVYLKIVDIVQKHEAQFAFPSQTVYLEKS